MSEEDKLLVEIQNIDNHQGVPLKNRITANEMKQILELAKRYTLSKQIEALENTRVIKYGKTYSDATDWKHEVEVCEEDTGKRIAELRRQQELR